MCPPVEFHEPKPDNSTSVTIKEAGDQASQVGLTRSSVVNKPRTAGEVQSVPTPPPPPGVAPGVTRNVTQPGGLPTLLTEHGINPEYAHLVQPVQQPAADAEYEELRAKVLAKRSREQADKAKAERDAEVANMRAELGETEPAPPPVPEPSAWSVSDETTHKP